MRFADYLAGSIWEYLLLAVSACALSYTLLDSFYIASWLQHGPIAAVASFVLLALLFAIAFNKRAAKLGGIAYALLCVVILVAAGAMSGDNPFDDAESSYFFFVAVAVITPTLAFLLTRKRGLTVLYFLLGIAACSLVQFFYSFDELAWTLAFLVAGLALVVYKNYQQCARTAASARKVSFAAGFAVALASVGVACLAGAGIWFGIIAPLDPSAVQIKLITEYRALEAKQVVGTSSVYQVPNFDITSSKTNDEERTTDDIKLDDNGRAVPAQFNDGTANQDEEKSGSFMGIDITSPQELFDFENNTPRALTALLVLLIIPVAIIAYFVGRRIHRSRRLARIRQQPPSRQIELLYPFLVGRMARVGIAMPAGSTPLDYARNNVTSMELFSAQAGVSFAQLTESFVAVAYGKAQASQEQADSFAAFYRGFWKAARKYLGNFRYFTRSFRL